MGWGRVWVLSEGILGGCSPKSSWPILPCHLHLQTLLSSWPSPYVSLLSDFSLSLETIRKKNTRTAGVYWRQSRPEASNGHSAFRGPLSTKEVSDFMKRWLGKINAECVLFLSYATDSLWTQERASQRKRLKWQRKVNARNKLTWAASADIRLYFFQKRHQVLWLRAKIGGYELNPSTSYLPLIWRKLFILSQRYFLWAPVVLIT